MLYSQLMFSKRVMEWKSDMEKVRAQDVVLDIYRMLWEAEIIYIDNGELEKAGAITDMRRMIKLKYDAKEEE